MTHFTFACCSKEHRLQKGRFACTGGDASATEDCGNAALLDLIIQYLAELLSTLFIIIIPQEDRPITWPCERADCALLQLHELRPFLRLPHEPAPSLLVGLATLAYTH